MLTDFIPSLKPSPAILHPSIPCSFLTNLIFSCLFIALVLILLVIYFYSGGLVSKLPSEVRWTFELYERSRFYLFNRWSYRGSSQTGYYYQEFSENSDAGQKAKKLFEKFQPGELKIKNMYFVYNPVLIANFVRFSDLTPFQLCSSPLPHGCGSTNLPRRPFDACMTLLLFSALVVFLWVSVVEMLPLSPHHLSSSQDLTSQMTY